METVKCPKCGKDVAKNAEKCPNCGKKMKKGAIWFWLLLGVIVIAALIYLLGFKNKPAETVTPAPMPAQTAPEQPAPEPAPAAPTETPEPADMSKPAAKPADTVPTQTGASDADVEAAMKAARDANAASQAPAATAEAIKIREQRVAYGIKTTAEGINAEFNGGRADANTKYSTKDIIITGTVVDVKDKVITLDAGGKAKVTVGMLAPDSSVKSGDKVTILCNFNTYTGTVDLKNGEILR